VRTPAEIERAMLSGLSVYYQAYIRASAGTRIFPLTAFIKAVGCNDLECLQYESILGMPK
jgi:hypothetical protein